MEFIIWSVFARAQYLYPIRVCAFVVMGNHLHLLVVVENPDAVAAFMDRIKTELGHAVNLLLGRRQRTVWCDDYDCQPILTLEDARSRFAYLYTNPQRARLIPTIQEYPGVSSWDLWRSGVHTKSAPWVQRPFIERLQRYSVNEAQDLALTEKLHKQCQAVHEFRLEPNAWYECFGITEPVEIARNNDMIIADVREQEAALFDQFKGRFLGVARLRGASIAQPYSPKKFAQRMWCICRDIERRKSFIVMVKALRAQARDVWRRWKQGDYSVRYPLGLFAPSLPRTANLPSIAACWMP